MKFDELTLRRWLEAGCVAFGYMIFNTLTSYIGIFFGNEKAVDYEGHLLVSVFVFFTYPWLMTKAKKSTFSLWKWLVFCLLVVSCMLLFAWIVLGYKLPTGALFELMPSLVTLVLYILFLRYMVYSLWHEFIGKHL